MNALPPLRQAGRLKSNSTVTSKRRGGQLLTAAVQSDGSLTRADRKTHRTPSGHAEHHTSKPINGWDACSLPDGRRLSDLRAEIGGSTDE